MVELTSPSFPNLFWGFFETHAHTHKLMQPSATSPLSMSHLIPPSLPLSFLLYTLLPHLSLSLSCYCGPQ